MPQDAAAGNGVGERDCVAAEDEQRALVDDGAAADRPGRPAGAKLEINARIDRCGPGIGIVSAEEHGALGHKRQRARDRAREIRRLESQSRGGAAIDDRAAARQISDPRTVPHEIEGRAGGHHDGRTAKEEAQGVVRALEHAGLNIDDGERRSYGAASGGPDDCSVLPRRAEIQR